MTDAEPGPIEEALATVEKLTKELDESYAEATKLESELRREKDKNLKLWTRLGNLERLLSARTTALCSLIELPDPRWQPSKEDMTP